METITEKTHLIGLLSGNVIIGQCGIKLVVTAVSNMASITFEAEKHNVDYFYLGDNQIIDQHSCTFQNTMISVVMMKYDHKERRMYFHRIYRKGYGRPESATCFVCANEFSAHDNYIVARGDNCVYEIKINYDEPSASIKKIRPGDLVVASRRFALLTTANGYLGIIRNSAKHALEEYILKKDYDSLDSNFNTYCVLSRKKYIVLAHVGKFYDKSFYHQYFVYSEEGKLLYITETFYPKEYYPKDVIICGNLLFVYSFGKICILLLDPKYKPSKLGKSYTKFTPGSDCTINDKLITAIKIPEHKAQSDGSVYFGPLAIYMWQGSKCFFNPYRGIFRARALGIDIREENLPEQLRKEITGFRQIIYEIKKGLLFPKEIYRIILNEIILLGLFGSS